MPESDSNIQQVSIYFKDGRVIDISESYIMRLEFSSGGFHEYIEVTLVLIAPSASWRTGDVSPLQPVEIEAPHRQIESPK